MIYQHVLSYISLYLYISHFPKERPAAENVSATGPKTNEVQVSEYRIASAENLTASDGKYSVRLLRKEP